MSRRRPLTLTIANGSAITAQPAQIPSNRNAAAIAPVNPQKLAQIIDAYAGLLGVQSTRSDIEETMAQAAPDGDNAPQALIETGLRSLGCLVKSVDVSAQGGVHGSDHWPALAMMTNGQIILVLEQLQDEMIVYDTTCADNRAAVPLAEFAPFFTGEILCAEVPLRKLTQRHQIDAGPTHWFWGAFRPFRRQLGEIALGSLVANLLAVAVALFSLQVYDRVIPHQSEATLWVLAIGALVALTLEGGIKIARAHLMDGAGRQIELGVQEVLMRRIMGMRSDVAGQAPSTTFSAMREFSAVREFFTASTVGSLADLPFVFLFLLLVWSIAGGVVWVLILGGILMVVPGFILQKRLLALTEEAQGASAKSTRLLHEVIFERDTLKTQRGEARAADMARADNTQRAQIR